MDFTKLLERGEFTAVAVTGVGVPDYIYSIGLTEQGYPEVIITGLDLTLARDIIDKIPDWSIEVGGFREIKGINFKVREVHKSHYHLAKEALNFYGDDLYLVQLIWPNEDGIYRDDIVNSRKDEDYFFGQVIL